MERDWRIWNALIGTTFIVAMVYMIAPEMNFCQGTRAPRVPFSSLVRMTLMDRPHLSKSAGKSNAVSCSFGGNPATNINLRCGELTHPYAETAIAVDPSDPNHLLVGANDYRPADSTFVTVGFFVSFNGGTTWVAGNVPINGDAAADPSPVFNAKFGTAHMGQVDVECPRLRYLRTCAYSAEVSTSGDGGLIWRRPVIVAQGSGFLRVLNDKPWLVADNDSSSPFYGRLYLTWTRFLLTKAGDGVSSPINLSYSDDDGGTWTPGIEISGTNAAFCTASAEYRCQDDQFSTPVVLPGGVVVVHFLNANNAAGWEIPLEFDTQTMVVRSTNGGVSWSAPLHTADLEDGNGDLPTNVNDYYTQTGHQFTTWSVQGMTVDPITGILYAFWIDNRDGIHDSLSPVTQTNVFMTRSSDGGLSWTSPLRVTSGPGDRWMAWGGAYGGAVRVMFMDGSYDYPNRTQYGMTLASSSDSGGTWSFQRVDTSSSNPNNSFWFKSFVNDCFLCTTLIGDYQGMTVDSLGRTHIVWTDMRRNIGNPPSKAHDVQYARR